MSRGQDILGVIKGLQTVLQASIKLQENHAKHIWRNSSAKEVIQNTTSGINNRVNSIILNPETEVKVLLNNIKETSERIEVFLEGVKRYTLAKYNIDPNTKDTSTNLSFNLKDIEAILSENAKLKDRKYEWEIVPEKVVQYQNVELDIAAYSNHKGRKDEFTNNLDQQNSQNKTTEESATNTSYLPSLSSDAKQRKVPSSRLGRVATFGSLAAGLGFGTISELAKGAFGLGGSPTIKEALLSPANAERIVDTLCRVRGAALKLGQILSIQDDSVVPRELSRAFERVRQSADYMPQWQIENVMASEFGHEWRQKLQQFDEVPFAAASIGQVHHAVLLDNTHVAVKIQYPGVAKGIDSDINNLVALLKMWKIFPEGIFIDNIINVAKRELSWEVDYEREALFTEKYYELVKPYDEYIVPKVIKELSSRNVLTSELVHGIPIDQCFDLSEEHRNLIASYAMKLCLRELFVFRCMQTDPNWSNFLYNVNTKKLALIDFGATREYSKDFIDKYLMVIKAATENNRKEVLNLSEQMKFLTGYESKKMQEAHVDAVMILGEVFSCEGEFDFGGQSTTRRITNLVPTMVEHRLCPPPEEIYSLHRKISGVFLMCAKLKAKLACRGMFEEVFNQYKFD